MTGKINRRSGVRLGLAAGGLVFALFADEPVAAGPIVDAVRQAVDTHPTVLAAEALKDSAEEGIAEARSGLFPTVDLRSTAGGAQTNNATTRGRTGRTESDPQSEFLTRYENSLTVSQMLFDGFGTRNLIGAAQARFDASTLQLLDTGEQIGLRAATAYLDVARNRLLLGQSKDNVVIHEDILRRTKISAEAGGGSEADVSQADARLALATSTVDQIEGALRDSGAVYLEAVGDFPEDLLRPPLPAVDALPDAVDTIVEEALNSSPTVRAATATVLTRRRELDSQRSSFVPRVSFDLGGSRNENAGGAHGPNNDFTAQIVVTYNIFRGGGDSARRRSAAALVREAIQGEAETRRTVEVTARISFHALETARSQLTSLEQRALSSEEVVEAYAQQFTLGQRTLLDLLDVENELFQARVALVNGEFGVLLAYYRVLATAGRLLEYFGISDETITDR